MLESDERIPPTPETKAKLRQGTIEILLMKHRLSAEHRMAADDIEWVMSRVFGFLYAKNNLREPVDGSRNTNLSEAVAEAHQDRFKPWANWFKENRCDPVVSICLDIITDGVTARELDARHKKRKGWASGLLVEGLEKYAELAGWTKPKTI